MSYLTWSTTASANITVNGINIAENCPPANLNNAVREVMAGVAALRDAVPSTAGFVTASGAVFTTQPTYSGRGGLYHNSATANTDGRIIFLPEGSANPSASNGAIALFYS